LTEIKRRTGCDIEITHVGTRRDRPDLNLEGVKQSSDLLEIVRQPDVDIVIEVIGGIDFAEELMVEAIKHGKHIVTANKALIAEKGNELFALADKAGVFIAYEAAVAGGIPIIKVMRESLAANQIERLAGIINGTGNFILSEMQSGASFETALAQAQELGYAEADPTFDVQGIDAAHKLTILASIAFGIPLQFDKVFCEGIDIIQQADVEYARELGFSIKHLGLAIRQTGQEQNKIELRVHPTLIPTHRLITHVSGVKNAVMVKSDALGNSMYYGAGAGAGPTASAIVADVMDLVRALANPGAANQLVPHLAFQPDQISELPIADISEVISAYYLRLTTIDELGVLTRVTRILSDHGINIESIIQKRTQNNQAVPIIITTQRVLESKIDAAIRALESLEAVNTPIVRLRIEELN
jgi:homoserine dehydrogenase